MNIQSQIDRINRELARKTKYQNRDYLLRTCKALVIEREARMKDGGFESLVQYLNYLNLGSILN